MKKGAVKYIVGGSIVAAGVVLVTTAVCIDGWRLFAEFPEVVINPAGVHVYYGDGDYKYENGGATMENDNVKNIQIDIEYGTVTVQRGDVDKIDVQTNNVIADRFKSEVVGDTLSIRYKRGFSFFSFKPKNNQITITLPRDSVYDDVKITNGAGSMLISDFAAQEIDIDNGAGELKLENVSADSKLEIETGAGAVRIDTASCGRLKIDSGVGEVNATDVKCGEIKTDCGVGSFRFSGEINGDADISNGCGEIKMTIHGNSSDYGFDVDSGIGKVRVNGNTPVQTDNAKYRFKVSTGIGEVNINFE